MEMIRTMMYRPGIIDSVQYINRIQKPCEIFWREIKALSDPNLLPLLDTAQYFLNQARVFYPTSTPDIIVTNAQLYALRAEYHSIQGDTASAREDLGVSCHLISSALRRGFSQISIFGPNKRRMMYFHAFDLDWASEYRETLIQRVREYFPDASV